MISHFNRWYKNFCSRLRFLWNRFIYSQLIIESEYGGLGDHLLLSHLPRIAKENAGYKKVFISNKSFFRDPDVRELVWKKNPYVDGFIEKRGHVILPPHTQPKADRKLFNLLFRLGLENRITYLSEDRNLLDQFMISYGIDDRRRSHEPELYLNIQKVERLKDTIIYDPNYITNIGVLSVKRVENYFYQNEINIHAQMAIRNNSIPISKPTNTITTQSIFDFCSVIISCKELYCFTTGTATLAAALNKPCTVLYGEGINPLYHHSRIHSYIKI